MIGRLSSRRRRMAPSLLLRKFFSNSRSNSLTPDANSSQSAGAIKSQTLTSVDLLQSSSLPLDASSGRVLQTDLDRLSPAGEIDATLAFVSSTVDQISTQMKLLNLSLGELLFQSTKKCIRIAGITQKIKRRTV